MEISFLKKQKQQKHNLSDLDLITKNSSPVLTEALKSARTNLMYSLSDLDSGKCMIVTSALSAEGKTTTSINLAVSLAQTECRVLLVDADMRRPRVHQYLDIRNKEGLANYLGGFCELDNIICHLEKWNLDVVTAGNLPPNPTELLSSKKMQQFVATVKEQYDYILFDTPPVNIVADTITLTRLVDKIVFVCKCGVSITQEIAKAVSAIKFANAKMLGLISIDSHTKKKHSNNYSRYYSKYYYYQES